MRGQEQTAQDAAAAAQVVDGIQQGLNSISGQQLYFHPLHMDEVSLP